MEELKLDTLPVYAHIAGPSGSGKTHIGNLLRNDYIVKDLDDIWQLSEKTIHHGSIYLYLNSVKEITDRATNFVNELNKWIEEAQQRSIKKPILLVGLSYIIHKNTNKYYFIPIQAKYKYTIDINAELLLRQFIKRDIHNICTNPIQAVDTAMTGYYSEMWDINKHKKIKKLVDKYYVKIGYSKKSLKLIMKKLNPEL